MSRRRGGDDANKWQAKDDDGGPDQVLYRERHQPPPAYHLDCSTLIYLHIDILCIMADAPAPAAAKPKKEKKAPPEGLVIPPKKPKMTKAERRALQEAQRAAKTAGGGGGGGGGGGKGKGGGGKDGSGKGADNKASAADAKKSGDGGSGGSQENQRVDPAMDKRLPVFAHLPQYKGECQVKYLVDVLKFY